MLNAHPQKAVYGMSVYFQYRRSLLYTLFRRLLELFLATISGRVCPKIVSTVYPKSWPSQRKWWRIIKLGIRNLAQCQKSVKNPQDAEKQTKSQSFVEPLGWLQKQTGLQRRGSHLIERRAQQRNKKCQTSNVSSPQQRLDGVVVN